LPHTPDAIAVPLISAALRLIQQPAEDVIALRDRVQGIYQDGLDQGRQRDTARNAARIAASTFEFATLDNEEAPWHPATVSTKRVRFLVERIYDACFITIAYLVGARVSEIFGLEVGCIEQHASADGTETFSYLCGRIYKTAGYCVYRRESSACLGDDRGPNPALRTETTCITCANFAVTDKHRPVWEARHRRNLDLLLHPMLDAESRTLAQTRVAECDRVLAALDAGTAGYKDAI
jgi:hypothetical protein